MFSLQYSWNDACVRLWLVFQFLQAGKMHPCTTMTQFDDFGHSRCVTHCPDFASLSFLWVVGLAENERLVTAYGIVQNYFEGLLLSIFCIRRRHQFLNVNLVKPYSTGLMTEWVAFWKCPEIHSLWSKACTVVINPPSHLSLCLLLLTHLFRVNFVLE